MNASDGKEVREFLDGTLEALGRIRNQPARTHFYVRINYECPIPGTGTYLPGFASLKISRNECLKLAKEALGKSFEDRGAKIKTEEYVSGDYRAFYLF